MHSSLKYKNAQSKKYTIIIPKNVMSESVLPIFFVTNHITEGITPMESLNIIKYNGKCPISLN